jgi:hypothetical protein
MREVHGFVPVNPTGTAQSGTKLVKANNLVRADGRPFRMKFRVELAYNGSSMTHVIPIIVEPKMKPINGTLTYFMKIVGSTTGYAL